MSSLSYAAITPARNEAASLRRLAECLNAQSVVPAQWVVVDNGSNDETASVVAELAATHPWIDLVLSAGTESPEPGAPIVRAFHAGAAELREPVDVIVKLDADVTFDEAYFAAVLSEFERDTRLGIASGTCLELDGSDWKPVHVTGAHVRGATRAYRRECLEQLLPLEERVGWDGIDELKAAVLGWTTRMLPDTFFYHHRPVGKRDRGRGGRWRSLGRAAHYMGYRPSYLVLRALRHSTRQPLALMMIGSYTIAAIRRRPKYPDAAVRAYLRRQQRARELTRRARETLGKTSR